MDLSGSVFRPDPAMVLDNDTFRDGQPEAIASVPAARLVQAVKSLENIFKFLRLDYVWRLTYRDHPGIQTKGIRFMMKLSF